MQHLGGPGGQALGVRLAIGGEHRNVEHRCALRIEAGDARLLDFLAQQGPYERNFFPDVFRRLAPINIQVELDDHHRCTFVGTRRQAVDARHGVDRLFDLLGDFTLDDLGRRTRVVELHHHGGKVDVGELVYGQTLVAEQAQHHKGQHDHGGHDRVGDADAGEPHGRVAGFSVQPVVAQPNARGCRRESSRCCPAESKSLGRGHPAARPSARCAGCPPAADRAGRA